PAPLRDRGRRAAARSTAEPPSRAGRARAPSRPDGDARRGGVFVRADPALRCRSGVVARPPPGECSLVFGLRLELGGGAGEAGLAGLLAAAAHDLAAPG